MADPTIFPIPDPSVPNPRDLNSVWFEWKEDKDDAASAAAGHPVFDTAVIAHIMGPGLKRSEAARIVLRKRPDGSVVNTAPASLAPLLDAFLKGDPGGLAGTPLNELTILDSGAIATLKAIGVHNVEALAALNETVAPGLLGFRQYKTAAAAFLDQRSGQEPLNKLAAENERLKVELATVTSNYDDLAARVHELEGKNRKKAA